MRKFSAGVILLGLFSGPASALPAQSGDQGPLRGEEETDYFQKWLKEDVLYIITPEEKDIFQRLTTPEEKEQFIEQFWYRRDPDMLTVENEFKEEHYRRIAYANETFYSGEPGWMTDRGRVYILHGPPDQLESHPNGGAYHRPNHEGGGSTSVFPFEIWWYRYMEGVGSDVELEFVDRNGGNQYKLVIDPTYKDVLLHVNNAGNTFAEDMGIRRRQDRPYFSPWNANTYPMMSMRAKDDPFLKYETFAAVKRPVEVKFRDLQEIVKVNVEFSSLPFQLREDYFSLNEQQVLVPVTVQWDNKDLAFEPEGRGFTARLGVYGMVTSLQNRVVSEFEDEVAGRIDAPTLEQGLQGRSVYQKVLVLDKKLRYKLDIVVKDLRSGQIGVIRKAIIPPAFPDEKLALSSMLLAEHMEQVDNAISKDDQMFVLGDIWVRPSLAKEFPANRSLGLYVQLYNFGIDQSSLIPDIATQFRVFRGDRLVLEIADETGESIHFFSGRRVVLMREIPVNLLNPGDYRVEVQVRDQIRNEEVAATDSFRLIVPRS